MNPEAPLPGSRLRQRLIWLVGLLVVVLIGVLADAALHRDSGSDAMAAAGRRTAAMPGAHIALDVSYRLERSSDSYEGHGGGVYNARTGRSRLHLALPISARISTVRAVGDDASVYLRVWNLNEGLPPGKKWTQIETMLGHFVETAFATNGGPETTIDAVASVEGGELLDHETIRGEFTSRYRGTPGFAREAQVLRDAGKRALAAKFELLAERYPAAIPVEAWVDSSGLVRKIHILEPLPELPDKGSLKMDMTMELFDFGEEPKIDLPSSDITLDYSPVTRAELQILNGASNVDLIAKRAPELPEAEFHRRGLAVCDDIESELESISAAATKAFGESTVGPPHSTIHSPVQSLAAARLWAINLTGPVARLEKSILGPLASLGPPSDVAAPYHQLLKRFAVDAEARAAQATALELGNFEIYTRVEREFFTHDAPEEKALMREAGLGDCLAGGHSAAESA